MAFPSAPSTSTAAESKAASKASWKLRQDIVWVKIKRTCAKLYWATAELRSLALTGNGIHMEQHELRSLRTGTFQPQHRSFRSECRSVRRSPLASTCTCTHERFHIRTPQEMSVWHELRSLLTGTFELQHRRFRSECRSVRPSPLA